MNGGNGPPDGIKKQDGRAVGCERDQRDARLVRDLCVADLGLLPQEARAAVSASDTAHNVRVQLLCKNGILRTEAHGAAENAVIFIHVFRLVAAMGAKVEAGEIPLADAAIARGEAVDAALQRIGGQIFQFSMFDGVKHSFPQMCGHRESLPQVSARNEGGADQALF